MDDSRITAVIAPPDGGLERVLVDNELAVHLYDEVSNKRIDASALAAFDLTEAAAFIAARRNQTCTAATIRIASHSAAPAIQLISCEQADAMTLVLRLRDLLNPFPPNGALVMVPAPNQLMLLPLVDLTSLGWMDVLVNAGRTAYATASEPFSPSLYWYDGADFERFAVRQTSEGLQLDPPTSFRSAVTSLASRALRRVDAVA